MLLARRSFLRILLDNPPAFLSTDSAFFLKNACRARIVKLSGLLSERSWSTVAKKDRHTALSSCQSAVTPSTRDILKSERRKDVVSLCCADAIC